MPEIYLLSGLGADKRVFDFIDLSGYKFTHVEWIKAHDGESIKDYATRLLQQITTPCPILIGVSFGGMMAIELSRQIETTLIITISSARGQSEIPLILRLVGKAKFNRLVPAGFLKM